MAHSSVFVSERIDDDNEARTKRARRDQSGVTGKNIVVLRKQDVVTRDGGVFMPNTIEMACIKKPGTGQFKTNVEFSSIMSEDDVKERLERTFPLLSGQRFYCAAAADSRTRLEFHGKPRLWNGRTIKKWIKGNSALYILTGVIVDMPGTLEFSFNTMNSDKDNSTEQFLRRTHPDDMRWTLTDSVKVPVSQVTAAIHYQSEEQVNSAMLDVQTKCTTSEMIKYSTASGMMASSSLCSSSQSLNQVNTAMTNLKVIHSKDADLTQHSCSTNAPIELWAFDGNSQDTPMQSCVSSTTALASSHSSDAPTRLFLEQDLQKGSVNIKQAWEKCAATSRHLRKEGHDGAASSCYHGLPLSTTQSTESDSGVETAENSLGSVSSQATGLSDLTEHHKYKSHKNPPRVEEVEQMEMPILEREFGEAVGDPLLQLSVVASKIRSAITKKPSIVRDISPRSSPVQGGSKFYIILEECLPRGVSFGHAFFGSFGCATWSPVNYCTLTGTVPPAQSPGIVTVTVKTSEEQYLGESLFEYVDEMLNTVRCLVRNRRLQMQFHHLMTHELGKVVEVTDDNPKPVSSKVQRSGHQTENDLDYYGDAESSSRESAGSSEEEEDGSHPVDAKVWRTMQKASSDDEKDHFSDKGSLVSGFLDYSSGDMNAVGNMCSLFSGLSLGNSVTSADKRRSEESEESLTQMRNIKSVLRSLSPDIVREDRFSSLSCASGSGQKLQLNSYNADSACSVLVLPSAENYDFDWQSNKDDRSIRQTEDYHQTSSQKNASLYLDSVYQSTGRTMVQETCNETCENPEDHTCRTKFQDCSEMRSPRSKMYPGTLDVANCVLHKVEQREKVGLRVNQVCDHCFLQDEHTVTQETVPSNLLFSRRLDYLGLQQCLEEDSSGPLLYQPERPLHDFDEQAVSDRATVEVQIQLHNSTLDDSQSSCTDRTKDSQCESGQQDERSSGFDGEV